MKPESCPTCGLNLFPLWSHALIPALNWLFQLISHELIRVKTLQETRLFRTENRSSVQTSSWPAAVSTPSFAFLTFHNYRPNYPLLGGLVCMAAFKLKGKQTGWLSFFWFKRNWSGDREVSEQAQRNKTWCIYTLSPRGSQPLVRAHFWGPLSRINYKKNNMITKMKNQILDCCKTFNHI